MRARSWAFLGIVFMALASMCFACGSGGGGKFANIKAGEMPSGEAWPGVYYNPVYGYLHMLEQDGNIVGRWKRTDGSHCFAEGPTGGFKARPTDTGLSLLSGIGCRPGYPFPSRRAPIFDLTAYHASSFSRLTGVSGSYVWRLRGFAADPVSKVGVVSTDGVLRDVTTVENNVYDAVNLPRFSPKQIVAFDKNGKRVYVQCLQKGSCK